MSTLFPPSHNSHAVDVGAVVGEGGGVVAVQRIITVVVGVIR